MTITLVFDLDGTLANTQKIHQKIESEFLEKKGVFLEPHDIGVRFAGRIPQEWIHEVLGFHGKAINSGELEEFVSGKDTRIISLLKSGEIEIMPYALDILSYLYKKGYKLGISSGACREFIDTFIGYFQLKNIIIASTSANEVIKKKPHPDVFLATFEKIEKIYGLSEKRYVVGDGWSDVKGGYLAGATTIWLNPEKKEKLDQKYCNFEIESLRELQNIL